MCYCALRYYFEQFIWSIAWSSIVKGSYLPFRRSCGASKSLKEELKDWGTSRSENKHIQNDVILCHVVGFKLISECNFGLQTEGGGLSCSSYLFLSVVLCRGLCQDGGSNYQQRLQRLKRSTVTRRWFEPLQQRFSDICGYTFKLTSI